VNIKTRLVPAYEDDFYAKFPLLFADVLVGTKSVSPFTDWGIECGIGWRSLLDDLLNTLEAQIGDEPERDRPTCRITQIKQKFGTLRVYMSRATEEMHESIARAEVASAKICESCGWPGSLDRKKRYLRVECNDPECPGKATP